MSVIVPLVRAVAKSRSDTRNVALLAVAQGGAYPRNVLFVTELESENVIGAMGLAMQCVVSVVAQERSNAKIVMIRAKLRVMTVMVLAITFAWSAMVRVISCQT